MENTMIDFRYRGDAAMQASPRPTVQRRTGAPRKYLLPTPKHDFVRANTTWQRVANVRKLSFDLDYYVKGYL